MTDNPLAAAGLIALGLLLGLWQLALITNFRGYRDSHARRSLQTMGSAAGEGTTVRKFTTVMQIGVGTVFLLVALGMIALGVINLVGS